MPLVARKKNTLSVNSMTRVRRRVARVHLRQLILVAADYAIDVRRRSLLAEFREEFGVSVAPLLEQHEQDGVERTVLGRQSVVDKLDDILQALRRDPDEEAASTTDVVGRRAHQVVGQRLVTVRRQLQRSLEHHANSRYKSRLQQTDPRDALRHGVHKGGLQRGKITPEFETKFKEDVRPYLYQRRIPELIPS